MSNTRDTKNTHNTKNSFNNKPSPSHLAPESGGEEGDHRFGRRERRPGPFCFVLD